MIQKQLYSTFKNGSRTYFYSSLFFPAEVKADVFALYAFVRTADNFVDQTPPMIQEFKEFQKIFESSQHGNVSGNVVIDSFVSVIEKRGFDLKWVEAFLDAMELDLTKTTYRTLKETQAYMYGSAEVIGLMMAKILNLPAVAYSSAQYLGRSMQYVNFIRDVQEDIKLGRTYFPQSELKKYGVKSLEQQESQRHPAAFSAFMKAQIELHHQWSNQGIKGYRFIPKRYLVPIKTANDLYEWTARQITQNPLLVYQKKIKPSVARILFFLIKNTFFS